MVCTCFNLSFDTPLKKLYNFVKVVFAIEQLTFNDIIHNIVTNDYFALLGALIGFIGFYLTIKIDKRLNSYKLTEQFNTEHEAYSKIFKEYRISITEYNVNINKVKHDILEQLEKFVFKYNPIIGIKLKFHIYFLSKHLKKEKNINTSKICNYLTKLSGILLNNKENSL